MDLKPIPYSFLRGQVCLTPADALWGYEQQLIGWSAIVDVAAGWLDAEGKMADPLIAELATVDKSHTYRVGELIRRLAGSGSEQTKATSKHKWLKIILGWLFFNKDSFSDPLQEVELIYADFGYPPDIESFVRYMPCSDGYDPTAHSSAENEKRLLDNWERYLHDEL